jgi:hypothetical protein
VDDVDDVDVDDESWVIEDGDDDTGGDDSDGVDDDEDGGDDPNFYDDDGNPLDAAAIERLTARGDGTEPA